MSTGGRTEQLRLVLDTATHQAVLALATRDGRLIDADAWMSGHRHSEELLPRLDGLLDRARVRATDLGAIVAGTGPGSFTGLRIGLATAKVLAYSLGVPLVGIPTTRALGRAVATTEPREVTVVLPAGARDRYVTRLRVGPAGAEELAAPALIAAVSSVPPNSGALLAVDLEPPEVPADAVELGRRALAGLAEALAAEGAEALAAGRHDDVAELVPAYVALPRGVGARSGSVEWSPDLR